MGIINRADALTKPRDESSLKQHLHGTNQDFTKGRHEFAPKLSNNDHLNEAYEEDEEE